MKAGCLHMDSWLSSEGFIVLYILHAYGIPMAFSYRESTDSMISTIVSTVNVYDSMHGW